VVSRHISNIVIKQNAKTRAPNEKRRCQKGIAACSTSCRLNYGSGSGTTPDTEPSVSLWLKYDDSHQVTEQFGNSPLNTEVNTHSAQEQATLIFPSSGKAALSFYIVSVFSISAIYAAKRQINPRTARFMLSKKMQ
jgi:hypothetical protein